MEPESFLIGRKEEIKRLNAIANSPHSEFLVVYGRRRVGKTFLIKEFFEYRFSFYITGVANATTQQQLFNFHTSFTGQSPLTFEKAPGNWLEAFQRLMAHLEQLDITDKKVVFFDEMPWLDTKGADFIMALEHFWNSWATNRRDIVLVACGSAVSWMINELINGTGGLHNRVTQQLKIIPFTLGEAEAMLLRKNAPLSRYQVVQLYMAMGGIPYYLNMVAPGLSAAQNIQRLFFDKAAPLRNEFFNLYRSLFKKHEIYEKLVAVLFSKTAGFQRSELAKQPGLSSGGTLTKVLNDLEESGFITAYSDLYNKQKNTIYRLSDYYTAFYFRFIQKGQYRGEQAWVGLLDNPMHRAWQGLAFEQVCIDHVFQIKKALGISGILSHHLAWSGGNGSQKAQIDLLIDRRDAVINICEAKFSINPYTIDKAYADRLREKIGVFKAATRTKKAVFLAFITTYGIEKNKYALELVQHEVTMEDLFDTDPTAAALIETKAGDDVTVVAYPTPLVGNYSTGWSIWQKIRYVLKGSSSPMGVGVIYEAICKLEALEADADLARKLYININATLSAKFQKGVADLRRIKTENGYVYKLEEA
jgi:uncharacterized protein